MKIWDILSVGKGTEGIYLKDGWEPFAVTVINIGGHLSPEYRYLIWLRRRVIPA